MKNKKIKLLSTFAILICLITATAHSYPVTVDIGSYVVNDLDNNMPRDPGWSLARAIADQLIGTGVYKEYDGTTLWGTNISGTYDRTVTVTNSGEFTISGGVAGGPITGSMSTSESQSISGSNALNFSWSSRVTSDGSGRIAITYSYSIRAIPS